MLFLSCERYAEVLCAVGILHFWSVGQLTSGEHVLVGLSRLRAPCSAAARLAAALSRCVCLHQFACVLSVCLYLPWSTLPLWCFVLSRHEGPRDVKRVSQFVLSYY